MLHYLVLALFSAVLSMFPPHAFALDFTRINVIPSPTPTSASIRILPIATVTPSPTPTPASLWRLFQVTTPTTSQRTITTPQPSEGPIRKVSTPVPTPSTVTGEASVSAIASAAALLGTITRSEMATREGRLVYLFTTREKLKLFGLIPVEGRALFEVDQVSHELRKVTRPWWSFLAIKPDWKHFFSMMGPNLTITDVSWDKKSYHAGDDASINFKIKNTGTDSYSGSFDVAWREGEKAIKYYKNFYTYLKPGESVNFDYFKHWVYECDQPIFLEIDETNKVKETDKSDNVWQGVSNCAPTSGPDLAVTQLKLQNPTFTPSEKWVGIKNTVKYTIANLGNLPSVKTHALMKTAGAQYLALLDVPILMPLFGQISGEVTYAPVDCSPIILDVDTENKNADTDKNNNSATEPPEVTDHCLKGPDVDFSLLYWTSKDGYSFGNPHKEGETLSFHVEIENTATDDTWSCAYNVQVGVYENDKLYTTLSFGNLGLGYNCPNGGGVGGTGDHITAVKEQNFYYPAKCGATIKFIINPNNLFSEANKSNNTWSRLIECKP